MITETLESLASLKERVTAIDGRYTAVGKLRFDENAEHDGTGWYSIDGDGNALPFMPCHVASISVLERQAVIFLK